MLDMFSQLTTGQVLMIGVLAMVATMLLPRLIRQKLQWRTLFKKSDQVRLLNGAHAVCEKPLSGSNGNRGEIHQLASKLIRYARANSMRLVYPGTVKYAGECCEFTMLLVGKFGILAIKAYGFGGHVRSGSKRGDWQQTLNGATITLPSPIISLQTNAALLSKALAAVGMGNVSIETAAVFTHKPLELNAPAGSSVYDRDAFFTFLCQNDRFCKDNGVAVTQLSDQLIQLVKDRKPDA